MSADNRMLNSIFDELVEFGVGSDEAIDGGDAVDYLNDLLGSLGRYLRREIPSEQEPRDDPDAWSGGFADNH